MEKQNFERGAGILCHISSLPNNYGIGSLGKEAYKFADFVANARMKYWQILPLVQTGYGDSPYQSVCCHSGNPYFIGLEDLMAQGLLTKKELKAARMEGGKIDYGTLYVERYKILRLAFSRFDVTGGDFTAFEREGEFSDYALFMSLKQKYGGTFNTFPDEYKYKDKEALERFKAENIDEYNFWIFLQYEFFAEWKRLKAYANERGIQIIGDIPLYVAYDSSDVWAHPELFDLDEDLNPVSVAGVPPDYFSRTGQLWGNPIYNWDRIAENGYDWWINRIQNALSMYDVVRIDHFRGFDRYYKIPADAPTAETGEWVKGPGISLFEAAENRLGKLNVIAEDLGVIDEGVVNLREATGFPGMKILMFAFDGNENNEYLPEFIGENSVTYTGTHDNDTVLGFVEKMDERQFYDFVEYFRKALYKVGRRYRIVTRHDAPLGLCLCAFATRSQIAIVPIQDVLSLNNEYRMNTPSTSSGNWQFRLEAIPERYVAAYLHRLLKRTNRTK